jgi:hypothetical protein
MPYVTRNDQGQIIEVAERKTQGAREQVALDDPDLIAFLTSGAEGSGPTGNIRAALEASDLELIRVIEDVITVLIDKRIFMLTDLPPAAQQKLARRYNLRSKLSDLGSIIAEHEEIMLP